MGCLRIGRKLAQLSLEIHFRINRIMSRLNNVVDDWLDLIYEPDDFLYDLKSSLWKNGNAFGSKISSASAKFIRKIIGYLLMAAKS